ncbi:hypothetical protein Bpfe_010733, partial [Biomphalaria pfeifferi]
MTTLGCPSLKDTGLELSTLNTTVNTTVKLGCSKFGNRPTDSIVELTCLSTGNWSHSIPTCEWSWDLNTNEKVIFATAVAAGAFIIVILVAILVAYFCCYKKKLNNNEE